jgi:uncharacterized protein YkwD
MLKFFRKIFFISIVIGLLYVWVSFGERVNELLGNSLKGIFNSEMKTSNYYEAESDGYKLESLKKTEDKNSAKRVKVSFGGTEDEIIALINKERFDKGLDLVNKNEKLMKSSLAKAEDMKRDKYFEHVSNKKIQPWFFAEEANYRYEKFGENIALDYLSANSVHKAFIDSVGHRANILDKHFRDVGVAIFPIEAENGLKYVIVEHFGERLEKIKPEKREKYSDKSKRFCGIQKNKKKELKEMIKNQKKVIEGFEAELNKRAVKEEMQRLDALKKIKERVNDYLDDCKRLKKKYEKKKD